MIFALLLAAASGMLWHDPGRVEVVDFSTVNAPPLPPFTFLKEDMDGTSPKVAVRDAGGIEWRVKGGHDTKPETFVTRFVKALGYFAETTVFSAKGRIEKIGNLQRASGFIEPDGSYTWASFERVEPDAKFTGAWSWIDPSLRNTHELKGLKVLIMLFSNWDNKDSRDVYKGSNTSILEFADGRRIFFVNDWGQSLGSWAGFLRGGTNWNCAEYARQTPRFVTGVRDGFLRFGYAGGHTALFRNDIHVEDVRWLMQYLGRVTDAQLRAGLTSGGATPQEEECFTRSLRARIEQLRKITLQ